MPEQQQQQPWRPERTGHRGGDRLLACVKQIQEISQTIYREGPILWDRARQSTAPGFPASSEPGVIGAGGDGEDRIGNIIADIVDAHPFVGEETLCGRCRQVRNTAVHREVHDFVREAWFRFWDAVQGARDELVRAQRELESTFRPAERFVDPDARRCVSHLRIGVKVPAWEKGGGRCWWCWNERRLLGTGEDVATSDLRAYEERLVQREAREGA